MAKRRWDEAIKIALKAYTYNVYHNNLVYLYGAKGVRLTSRARVEDFFNAEPAYFSRYTNDELEQIIRNSVGPDKIAYDCSGFVGWLCIGDMQYSTGQIHNCSFITRDISAGVAGSILYTTYNGTGRHIALDCGFGMVADMACESTDYNIANHRAGVRYYRYDSGICTFELSGQSNVLDYRGAASY